MIEVEGPDGTIVEFPPDTPPDVLRSAMQRKYGGPSTPAQPAAPVMPTAPVQAPRYGSSGETLPPLQPAAPAAPAQPAPSLVNQIMGWANTADDVGANALRGARTGVSNLLGLPVDIVNAAPMALNMLPGVSGVGPMSPQPVGGSKSIDTALGLGIVPEPPNAGAAGRFARRVGEEFGAAAVPAGAALKTAERVGVEGARQLPTLARMFVEPAAVNPTRFIKQEAVMAGGAGMGAAAAGEATRAGGGDPNKGWGPLADMFGALAGGLGTAGAIKASRPLGDTARALMPGSKYNYADDFSRNNVAETLGAAYGLPDQPGGMNTQPLIDAIERGSKPGAVIPGFKESLADRTGAPGIASLEYSRQSGPNNAQFTTRRMENAEATNTAIQANAPTEATPGALRQTLEAERNTQGARAGQWAQINQQRADTLNQGLTPETTTAGRGATIRNEIETAREAARQETANLYRQTDLNQQVDFQPVTEAIDGVTNGLTATRRGLAPQAVIERVRQLGIPQEGAAGPPMASLNELNDLRSELLRLQRAALADPRAENGGRNAAQVIGQYADAVDDAMMRYLAPEDAANLRAARDARRTEADQFGRKGDPVAAAVGRFDGGTPRLRDEQLPGMFAQRDDALEALFARVDTPDARTAIREELLSRYQQAAGKPGGAERFMEQYRPQLGRFQGLEQELAVAARAREEGNMAGQLAEDFNRQFGKPGDERGTGTVGRYLKFDDTQADKAMQTVFGSPRPAEAMDELLRFTRNDPKATEAARRSFWNVMEREARSGGETTRTASGVQPWLPNAMRAFLNDPKYAAVAERLYKDNPEHLANVKQIAEVLQGTDVRTRAKAANTSGTGQSVNPVLTPETLQSRLYSYQRGAIGGNFLITSIAAVAGRRAVGTARTNSVNRLLDQALLDPEAAKILLKENNPANRTALRRVGKAWLGNEISGLVDALDGDNDPVKEAVGRK